MRPSDSSEHQPGVRQPAPGVSGPLEPPAFSVSCEGRRESLSEESSAYLTECMTIHFFCKAVSFRSSFSQYQSARPMRVRDLSSGMEFVISSYFTVATIKFFLR